MTTTLVAPDDQPALLIDVDGTLSPLAPRAGYATYTAHQDYVGHKVTLRLHPDSGAVLLDFAAAHDLELVWCTRWMDQANTIVGPLVGLPELPVAPLDRSPEWKYAGVGTWGAHRAVAWLDDALYPSPAQARFVRARRGVPTLLQRVRGHLGITRADLDAVARWRDQLV